MDKLILSVCLVVAAAAISEATVCTGDGDCGANECCYIKPEFMVVSKKRQLSLPQLVHQAAKTGNCETYRSKGDNCDYLETLNGHCGCATGMSCQWVPEITTTVTIVRRRPVHHDGPGAYHCVCEQYRAAGDRCDVLETANGHCGCESGLHCRWVPDVTTVGPGGRRSMVYHPEPGSYQCA